MTDSAERARRLLQLQRGICFICQKPLDLNNEEYEIDHVVPRAKGGRDDENNYAVTHKHCNRIKLDSDLRVARCLSRYEEIKNLCAESDPNRPNLGDFLSRFGGGKDGIRLRLHGTTVELELSGSSEPPQHLPVFKDQLSGAHSFFAVVPIEYLHHDEHINPRAVGSRVRGLIDEFLSKRPQLHPALAWASVGDDHGESRINVFDGQHKLVAQILLGVKTFPVRVFINPDMNVLLETNTRASTVLRQVAFDKSVQRFLGSRLYWEKIDDYRSKTGRSDEDLSFSEQDLVKFFKGENKEVRRYILDDVRTAVMHDPDNQLRGYVDFSGKGSEKPLSYSTIEKTFFSIFIHPQPMSTRMDYRVETGENPRQIEKAQLVQLMALFAEEVLQGSYDPDRGTYHIEEAVRNGDPVPDGHLRAVRMCREEVLHNLLRYVRECVKRFFLLHGRVVEDDELFQHRFPPQLWEDLRQLVLNLGNLPVWMNRDRSLSSAIFGGKQTYDFWKEIFATGRAPNGVPVLAQPLTLDALLQ